MLVEQASWQAGLVERADAAIDLRIRGQIEAGLYQ
jgi:hypothetical protein